MDRNRVDAKNHYHLRTLETLPLEQLEALQFERTKRTLLRAYHGSGFYRDLFDAAKVRPEDFKRLDDIERFPFTDKQALIKDQQDNPPFGRRLCVPLRRVRRVNLTSGTSGMGQEVHCHEDGSIRAANASTASHFAAAGLKKGDLSAVLYPLGTMTGGMLSYEGLRTFGATPLPLAVFNATQKIDMMNRFGVHHVLTTPAYLTRLTSLCMERGKEPRELFPRLKGVTLSTEPFSVAWAVRMEEIWGTVVHDIYGSTQLNLNYAVTCKYGAAPDGQRGYYHLADHFAMVEVIDHETHRPVRFGEWGEPVVTTFSREAMPLIRFRTNDRVRLLPPDLCDCGRVSRAMWEAGTISRYDDMIKIKATNVWPQTVDEVIFSFEDVDEYSGRVYIADDAKEVAEVLVEFKRGGPGADTRVGLLERIGEKIKDKTQVSMRVREVAHGTLPRFEYKARRWTDERIKGLERVTYMEKRPG
ncbi:MAG: hypothetical protein CVU57_30315 [Deltaproteobacteria bacterium HGW-Deltaproteobacteria-15]|jgi:phenylacetate-CoA ligase|nr:MAG: hypothetical protein CVU57_30315 [Deltaproteobacteria bacterium HGW-Deltaproteobacteria-15]